MNLETFLDDPDFEGEAETERTGIHRRRVELREGKYRVVFLGPFNVGKSALINALLGDEYLPKVLEECTTKLTRVVRGEEMKAVLRVAAEPLATEIDALRGQLRTCAPGASIFGVPAGAIASRRRGVERRDVFGSKSRQTLAAHAQSACTMIADEDFPQLRALRDRFDEIVVSLPNVMIEEDIATTGYAGRAQRYRDETADCRRYPAAEPSDCLHGGQPECGEPAESRFHRDGCQDAAAEGFLRD
jgi:hypothetical protein